MFAGLDDASQGEQGLVGATVPESILVVRDVLHQASREDTTEQLVKHGEQGDRAIVATQCCIPSFNKLTTRPFRHPAGMCSLCQIMLNRR
jgi:hypothetical protein